MAEAVGMVLLGGAGLSSYATVVLFGTTTVATAVGSAALLGGSLIASSLLAAQPYSTANPGRTPTDGSQTLKQSIPPRVFGYGRVRIGGAYMFYDANFVALGSSYDIIALHHGEVDGFAYWYLNDDLCIRTPANGITESVFYSDQRYTNNSIIIKVRYGVVPETYYTETAVTFPTKWTSDFRGDGIASMQLFCNGVSLENHTKFFPRGLPKPSAVMDTTAVFDPRDTTQSRGTPSTWKVSYNPVLQLIDYLTSEDHGLGQDWDTLIAPVLDDLMVEADYCDELVALDGGGYEPRYRSHGFAYLTTDPAEIISAILTTCDGWMAEGPEGAIALKVGVYRAPTVTLTDDHILGFTIDGGVRDEEAVNDIRFSYTPPSNDYREADGQGWQDDAAISAMGKVRSQQVPMSWVHSHSQCRRLAKRMMAKHQATRRGSMITTLYGLKVLGERWVAIQSDTISDLSNAVVEVTRARAELASGRVSFDWVLVNPNEIDAWDAATEEGTEPPFHYASDYALAPTITSTTDYGSQQIRVLWTSPQRPALRYVVRYRIGAGAETEVDFIEPPLDANVVTTIVQTPGAATYSVRCAFRQIDGTLTSFSSPVSVTVA